MDSEIPNMHKLKQEPFKYVSDQTSVDSHHENQQHIPIIKLITTKNKMTFKSI